uniref:Uncharacterized protein n=1 Tax=Cucumis melo TaxID=3656 RepID=A0A9I9DLC5_CUCME
MHKGVQSCYSRPTPSISIEVEDLPTLSNNVGIETLLMLLHVFIEKSSPNAFCSMVLYASRDPFLTRFDMYPNALMRRKSHNFL